MGALFGTLSALAIGLSDLFSRKVLRASQPISVSLAVSVVAVFTSLAAVGLFDSTMRGTDFTIGTVSGIGMCIGLVTYYVGLRASSSTVVTPVVAVLSAIIPYGYAVVRGSSPSWSAIAGAAVALAGLVVISTGTGAPHRVRTGLQWGVASGLGYGVALAALIDSSSGAGALPAVGQRLTASVLLLGLARRRSLPALPSAGTRTSSLLGGMFAGASMVLYLAGMRAEPTAAVITSSMFPAASVAVGHAVFGDPVSRRQLAGIVLMLAGIVGVVTG